MTLTPRRGGVVILLSFLVAFLLMVLPLPEWARSFRPQWYTLVLIYWCMASPQRVGVGVGWLTGIIVDVLTGTLLGQHALSLSVIAYITQKLHQRLRLFPIWQQSLSIFSLLLIDDFNTNVRWPRGRSIIHITIRWRWTGQGWRLPQPLSLIVRNLT
jgi:rod shape-determining protein MreD